MCSSAFSHSDVKSDRSLILPKTTKKKLKLVSRVNTAFRHKFSFYFLNCRKETEASSTHIVASENQPLAEDAEPIANGTEYVDFAHKSPVSSR